MSYGRMKNNNIEKTSICIDLYKQME